MRFFMNLGFRDRPMAVDFARKAEEAGFDGVTIPDHVAMPAQLPKGYPYTSDGTPPFDLSSPWPDVWVLIGAMAAVTARLRFRTNVYLLPLRHPLIAAKAIGTASDVSKGRVDLGVGVGWSQSEYEALGLDFGSRGAMMDEAIAALRSCWAPGPVTHHGRFWDFGPMYVEPVPAHPIPILVGGTSAPAQRRAVTLSDGFIAPPLPLADTLDLVAKLRETHARLGDGGKPFAIHAYPTGDLLLGDYRCLVDAGVDALSITPWPPSASAAEKFQAMTDFSHRVIQAIAPAT